MESASEFFGGMRALLGQRLGECRLEDGRWLCVTVIDLVDSDDAAIRRVGAELGVADFVRVFRADPDHLAAWERLRHDLINLWAGRDHVVQMSPTPDPGYQRPPVRIALDAAAEDVAVDLHARYGDFVALQLGARRYPPDGTSAPIRRREQPVRVAVDPDELRVSTDSAVVVVAGEHRRHTLLVRNVTKVPLEVHTNGSIVADIADPADGRIVGTSSGVRTSALVRFRVDPDATVSIPLHLGTDCVDPALGYVVPPGEWLAFVPLDIDDGRRLAATLPVTIAPPD